MTDNNNTSPNVRRKYKKKNNQNVKYNQFTQNEKKYEFNSYSSQIRYTSNGIASNFFSMNIFDIYTPEQIIWLVRDPMSHNQVLRQISNVLYSCNGIFANTVDYLTALPTLDKVVYADPNGKNQKKKKQNKRLMESTLSQIKHDEFVRDALFKGMIEGVAFYYFETTERPLSRQKIMSDYDVDRISEINEVGINASIISLPADYTKIVARKNESYVLAFDLKYFDSCEGESAEEKLRKYPKEIREAYHSKKRGWKILDSNKTIVHKIKSKREEPWGRPLVISAIADILYSDYFTDTKRNVLDEINNKIVYETFPEGKDKGTSALSQKQQEHQHKTVKDAVMTKNNRGGTSFFSVAAGTKINSIDISNTDIFDDSNESNLSETIAMDLGIAASLLNGSGSGTYSSQENNLELVSAQVFQWIRQIEDELNKCVNANIIKDKNNKAICKYLPTTFANKKSMISNAKELYLQGKGSLSLWASAAGFSPDVFFALLDQELEEDIENKYPVHQTSYTYSASSEAGRPVDEDSTNPSTLQTRASGSNNTPAPSKK